MAYKYEKAIPNTLQHLGMAFYYRLVLRLFLSNPLHIREVLTVWQEVVLRIHTNSVLVSTCYSCIESSLEGIVITLCLHLIEWDYLVDVYVINWCILQEYQLKTYCIVQALLVDCVSNLNLMTCSNILQCILIL